MENNSSPHQKPPPAAAAAAATVARCHCCGLTEECTEAYIKRVRDRYSGRWICGLCGEAVKDEIFRSERRIGTEEALNRHMNFCKNLGPPKNPTEELIAAVKQLLLRSLDSPRAGLGQNLMRRRSGWGLDNIGAQRQVVSSPIESPHCGCYYK